MYRDVPPEVMEFANRVRSVLERKPNSLSPWKTIIVGELRFSGGVVVIPSLGIVGVKDELNRDHHFSYKLSLHADLNTRPKSPIFHKEVVDIRVTQFTWDNYLVNKWLPALRNYMVLDDLARV